MALVLQAILPVEKLLPAIEQKIKLEVGNGNLIE